MLKALSGRAGVDAQKVFPHNLHPSSPAAFTPSIRISGKAGGYSGPQQYQHHQIFTSSLPGRNTYSGWMPWGLSSDPLANQRV